jgi:hypothetical protein
MSVARFILPLMVAPALFAFAPASAPASAAVVFDAVGDSHVFRFDGLTTLDGTAVAGTGPLDASLSLRLAGTNGYSWLFSYEVDNMASGAFDRARITGFGFDVSPDPTDRPEAIGTFARAGSGEVVPGFETDLCFMAGGSGCATSSSSGIRPNQSARGFFWLGYSGQQQMLELSNVFVRWQGSQVDKAVPKAAPTISLTAFEAEPAPEPAAWALMITGFGLVGAAARRRNAPQRSLA